MSKVKLAEASMVSIGSSLGPRSEPYVEDDGLGGYEPYVRVGGTLVVSATGTVADGADVTQGARDDAAVTNPATAASLVSILKGLLTLLTLSKGAGISDATTLRAVLSSDGPTVSALGALADAAVADANGSINAHVRQIAKAMLDGTQIIIGNVAHGVTDAGPPLKTGGKSTGTTPTAVTSGQRVDQWFGLNGQTIIGTSSSSAGDNASGKLLIDTAGATCYLASLMGMTNGTTVDRVRNNQEATVLTSAARTIATNSTDQTNYNAKGVVVTIDITAIAGSPSLTFSIKYKCTLSGKYVTLLASAALTGVGTTSLIVYPDTTPAANLVSDKPLPRVWRVEVAVGTADSVTYSISANYIN